MTITCESCAATNTFAQPYAYHAGFTNTGFLYSDSGHLVLTWSSFDPGYEGLIGKTHPWALSPAQRSLLESRLQESPDGGRWRFANPARCRACSKPISGSILSTIYYVVPHGSIVLDGRAGSAASLAEVMLVEPT